MNDRNVQREGALQWGWSAAIAVAAVAGSVVTACMMPFVAVAVMAAATLRAPQAVATVAVAWAANQLLGFALMGYPMTDYALGWGLALGAASMAALGIAIAILRRGVWDARLVLAALAGFGGFELLLYGYAHLAGGLGTFTPAIVGQLALNEGLWLAGLLAARALLHRAAPGLVPALGMGAR
ncbi:hypothetical protein [Sphingomonas hengshuiensis]|uniref:hypothetical protein n=1 Tax=Sphingomonas hengshuiensis TaxID=1609977 RepID=UPI0006971EFD|nr:hypothetical protein [Sphingomonas hengshuiensis]